MPTDEAAIEDISNIVSLEHVNLMVPDQTIATWFYIAGLGFTRDPYMMVSPENMWTNIGDQQIHLPTRGRQVLPGHVGLVIPDLAALQQRLHDVEKPLAGTEFAWRPEGDYVRVTCPWGNEFRCHAPRPEFGDMTLGIPYVEVLVKPGTAEAIARFYERVMEAPAMVSRNGDVVTHVSVGRAQALHFRESVDAPKEYPGHHIAVYVANFSTSYAFFEQQERVMEPFRNHQYRFKEIVDPETGEQVTELEHEVRSMKHPLYARALANRDAAQSLGSYKRGRDAFRPGA